MHVILHIDYTLKYDINRIIIHKSVLKYFFSLLYLGDFLFIKGLNICKGLIGTVLTF